MKNEFNAVLSGVEIGYKKGFVDGYNYDLPFENEVDEEKLKSILEPAIKKARKKIENSLLKIDSQFGRSKRRKSLK